jgi:DNA topoisomerase-2
MSTLTDTYLNQTYQQKSEIQHILDRPNVHLGSILRETEKMWVAYEPSMETEPTDEDDEDSPSDEVDETSTQAAEEQQTVTTATSTSDLAPSIQIKQKIIEFIPALYKVFDEAIVNARDHCVRMAQCQLADKKLVTFINVAVNIETGWITIMNDGDGLDVAKHPATGIWVPELIFGNLRTSRNFDDSESRLIGGQNGLGIKLATIWSTQSSIETVDHRRHLRYTQEFADNMTVIRPPRIDTVPKSTKPYVKFAFLPDYARFGIRLTPDIVSLFQKRTMDICALSSDKLKVTFNEVPIVIKNFQKYMDLYIGKRKRVFDNATPRWEVAVAISNTGFQQVSFVNGICTYKGGKHVDSVIGKIVRGVSAYIDQKKKMKVTPHFVKDQLFLFLKCDIENPSFDSQCKDSLNTTSDRFGSSWEITDAFIEKVAKMGVMAMAVSLTKSKDEAKQAKATDGKKGRVGFVKKYEPANWAGTPRSSQCTLILCEGDSAKSGVISGLSKEDRDIYGVYPLRGKLLNVRDKDIGKVENTEITGIKKILGLSTGQVYSSQADINRLLNYGRIMVLCDADTDGSHIKGLIINMFDRYWPSLLALNFITYMNTPILRATKAGLVTGGHRVFYHQGEYDQWKANTPPAEQAKWSLKYFKGLGTSTAAEFREYFRNKKTVTYGVTEGKSREAIDMAFNKERADDRKAWLGAYDRDAYIDTSRAEVKFEEFVDKELIHFSIYDCERSIPSVVDGLKPSQRKIMYCAFKRNLTNEIKVAQFAGYISEHSAYHHGEASLQGAIVKLAQNYMGSNNVNLLCPNGQFGTRLENGADAGSPRYIFTALHPITRSIFPKDDEGVLAYQEDDGDPIEPVYYVPILPMVLVNGAVGMGTGYSCEIPCYNPITIVNALRAKLASIELSEPFVPYYEGFKGSIVPLTENKFLIKGLYAIVNATTICVTELPVGLATSNFIEHLHDLATERKDTKGRVIPPIITEKYLNMNRCTDVAVDVTIEFVSAETLTTLLGETKNGVNGVEKTLKLATTISTTNMHLFDADGILKRYTTPTEIIDDFIEIRLQTYVERKLDLTNKMEARSVMLANKARYITETVEGRIDLRKKAKDVIVALLSEKQFALIDGSFEYLIGMRMDSVSKEKVAQLLRERDELQAALVKLRDTTAHAMWLTELAEFEAVYRVYKAEREALLVCAATPTQQPVKKATKRAAKV